MILHILMSTLSYYHVVTSDRIYHGTISLIMVGILGNVLFFSEFVGAKKRVFE